MMIKLLPDNLYRYQLHLTCWF